MVVVLVLVSQKSELVFFTFLRQVAHQLNRIEEKENGENENERDGHRSPMQDCRWSFSSSSNNRTGPVILWRNLNVSWERKIYFHDTNQPWVINFSRLSTEQYLYCIKRMPRARINSPELLHVFLPFLFVNKADNPFLVRGQFNSF